MPLAAGQGRTSSQRQCDVAQVVPDAASADPLGQGVQTRKAQEQRLNRRGGDAPRRTLDGRLARFEQGAHQKVGPGADTPVAPIRERQRSCGPTIGIATGCDKCALTYLGGVILAAAITAHRL